MTESSVQGGVRKAEAENAEVSLIITTYNFPQALRLTLQSVLAQSKLPDELIVADDGSEEQTAQVVKGCLRDFSLGWAHVWHEDRGVRQSRIKNLAVKNSRGTYLIFIDQDVILHPLFIADHLVMREKGAFLQGKRVLLPPRYTGEVLQKGAFEPPSIWMRGLGNRKNAFRSPLIGRIFARPKPFETSLRGCNLSMYRSDFLKTDGFDEVFDGSWGREDSDICYRLFHNGVRVRNLRSIALQYHLHHSVARHWDKERLDMELMRNVDQKRKRAVKGFSSISAEGGVIACSYPSEEQIGCK